MKKVLIFGREPVTIVNAIEGLLCAALAFGLLSFAGVDNAEEVAIIMAIVSGVLNTYVAFVTKDTLLAAVLGLVKASVPAVAAFGYNVTDAQLAQLMGAIILLLALWHRTQTGPAAIPSFNLSQHSVDLPPEAESTAPIEAQPVIVEQTGVHNASRPRAE